MKPVIPKFETKDELFDHLIANKEDYIYQKKADKKLEDSIGGHIVALVESTGTAKKDFLGMTVKAEAIKENELEVELVINTTNYLDSHGDVHIKGLWNRSIKNNTSIKFLQEHEMRFDKVIADKDNLAVSVKEFTWKELGYDVEGLTQALVFDATVKESRNSFMFNEYKSGNVDQHSVGMQYVHIKLAVNSDKDAHKTEKEVWDKYANDIANQEEVEKAGYFWAILEAKAIEGSAVLMGSNPITPTLAREKHQEKDKENQLDTPSPEKTFMNKFKI